MPFYTDEETRVPILLAYKNCPISWLLDAAVEANKVGMQRRQHPPLSAPGCAPAHQLRLL